jgi:hypothetical protein
MNMTLTCSGTGTVSDLELTSAAAFQFLAPLQTGQVSVQVCNISCGNYANSVIKIALPTGVVPDLSNLSSATYQNDTVTIAEMYLSGCMTYSFPCAFPGTTPAGTQLNFSASVLAQGEQDLQFNSANFAAIVLNSYDPNDKQCHLPTNILPFEQEDLGYTVRFQNDGNYPALNVVIRDTISTNLDLSTFRLLSAKHPVSYSINPTSREIVFSFSGIQLQPSQDDLEGGMGSSDTEMDGDDTIKVTDMKGASELLGYLDKLEEAKSVLSKIAAKEDNDNIKSRIYVHYEKTQKLIFELIKEFGIVH